MERLDWLLEKRIVTDQSLVKDPAIRGKWIRQKMISDVGFAVWATIAAKAS